MVYRVIRGVIKVNLVTINSWSSNRQLLNCMQYHNIYFNYNNKTLLLYLYIGFFIKVQYNIINHMMGLNYFLMIIVIKSQWNIFFSNELILARHRLEVREKFITTFI